MNHKSLTNLCKVVVIWGGVVGENAVLITSGMQVEALIVDKYEAKLKQLVAIFGYKIFFEQSDKINWTKFDVEVDRH